MPKFTLTIGLGNDAMQTPFNVSRALAEVATYLNLACGEDWHVDAGLIRDANGNTVGGWEVDTDAEDNIGMVPPKY